MKEFNSKLLKDLYKPVDSISKRENGQVTIIGGSSLFHGAPLLSLKVASRIVGMVYFSSPEKSVGEIANKLKSNLFSFIWVPWEEVGEYIKKSDSVLIGPGFMRYRSEKDGESNPNDTSYLKTEQITKNLLTKYKDKKWVIDAGSLQLLKKEWIPKNAILTPNTKEYEMLFGDKEISEAAKENSCIIVHKTAKAVVCSPQKCIEIGNGNKGLIKGGTGDTQAGLTVALLAKNDPFLAASVATYVIKKTADKLYETRGTFYNADDLADSIPEVFNSLL
ncbi:MAG: ADP/ATP-dependent (S)-NAD(P)H-hydrate dehydratase [Patescibacteria group bacterium]